MLERVVVVGASGFVGRRVLHYLARSGWAQAVAVSRHASALRIDGVESIDVDVADAKAFAAAVRGASGIVNCLAASPELMLHANERLLRLAAQAATPPRIVYLGSLAAYGSTTGVVDEQTPLRGDTGAYSAAKAQADRLAGQYPFVVILRPGIIYGPGSGWWSDRIARLLVARRLAHLGSDGAGHCNLVFVDDVARCAVRALQLPQSAAGAYNLSWPQSLTWNDYFERYGAALGVAPVRRISHARLLLETRLLAPPLKLWELLLMPRSLACWNPLPPLRPWLVSMCRHDIRMDVSRAETSLGMGWTALETGLRLSADWFLAGGRTA